MMSELRRNLSLYALAASWAVLGVRSHVGAAELPAQPKRATQQGAELSAPQVEEIPERRVLVVAAGERLDERDASKVGELSLRLLDYALQKKLTVKGTPFAVNRSASGTGGYDLCVQLALPTADPDPAVGAPFEVKRLPAFLAANASCTTPITELPRCIELLMAHLSGWQVEQVGTPALEPSEYKASDGRLRFRVVIPVKRQASPAEGSDMGVKKL